MRVIANCKTGDVETQDLTAEEIAQRAAEAAEWEAGKVQREEIPAIKAKAGETILAQYSETKQRNMLARYTELVDTLTDGGTLSVEEITERVQLKAAWSWIKSVRAHSDTLEAKALAGEPYDIDTGWPQN